MKVYRQAGACRMACPKSALEEGHKADVHFVWQADSEHAEHHAAELTCSCGLPLAYVNGDDPYIAPFTESPDEPHQP